MLTKIKRWYEGTSRVTTYSAGTTSYGISGAALETDYHWTAKATRAAVHFYLQNWQWVWGFLLAVAGFIVSVLALK